MRHFTRAQIAELANDGVILSGQQVFMDDSWKDDFQLAADAQPQLVTVANAGIPAFLTTMLDPEVVRTVVTPMRFAEVFGEVKKGDWTDDAIQFPTIESSGFVTSYGDWNNNGNVNVNPNWTPRQPYFYQTVQQYGSRELDKWGRAKLNYVAELDNSAALVMNKAQNLSYAFGVAGLQNYGVLNDPGLLPSILPGVKAAGGTSWNLATRGEIFNDFLTLFTQLQAQMGGSIKQTDNLLIVLSPGRAVALSRTSDFGIPAITSIMMAFPNLKIETIPEYSTSAGEIMQLILQNFNGTKTIYCAFPEKMRLFPVIPSLSGWQQKKAGGTWGAIIRRPIAISTMLGI